MADKKDENQGAEFPEDDKPSDGPVEAGKPVDGSDEMGTKKAGARDTGSEDTGDSPDIVEAEFEEIPEEGKTDDVSDESSDGTTEDASGDPHDETDATEESYDDLPPAEPILVSDEDLRAESETSEPDTDTAPEPVAAPAEKVVEKTIIQKRGFFPVFLGGVIAAVLGFGAARYGLPESVEAQLPPSLQVPDYDTPIAALEDSSATQGEQLSQTGQQLTDLGGRLDELSSRISDVDNSVNAIEMPDLTPLQNGISGLGDDIAALRGDLETARADARKGVEDLTLRLDAMDVRVSALEKRPITENLSDEAIAAYERELDAVRRALADERNTVREEFDAMIADQGDRMQGIVDDERARIDALLAEAQAMVDDAKTVADQTAEIQVQANRAQVIAAAQSAVAIVRGALDDGVPYADKLDPIRTAEIEIPAGLSNPAADGVATLGTLLSDYPAAARDALDAARHADPESTRGLGAFLQRELGARSTTPQEGDDADAILSRAEAALKREDLSTALTELQALPAPAADAMAGWVELATVRRDALAALADVSADLNTN